MNRFLLAVLFLLALTACKSSKEIVLKKSNSINITLELLDHYTFKIKYYSQDKSYGYTPGNPVKVGGVRDGPLNERRFLNALTGPNGERVNYSRVGSCCGFDTPNSPWGGLLDIYSVTYKGLDSTVNIYINMYDADTLRVPVGFRFILDKKI